MLFRHFINLPVRLLFLSLLTGAVSTVAIAQEDLAEVAEDTKKTAEAAKKAADTANEKLEEASKTAKAVASEASDNLSELQKLLEQQQALLEQQQKQLQQQADQLEQQNKQLQDLQKQLNQVAKEQEAAKAPLAKQEEQIESQSAALAGLQTEVDLVKQAQEQQKGEPSPEEIALKERIAALESSVSAIPQDPATLMGMETFPGSIRVPGTNGAIKFGGFVKVVYVNSLDPILSRDRFLVGSIPVVDEFDSAQRQTNLAANQSRFNVEVRENSSLGKFRAFIEGDFGEENNTFRLRHAFGQYKAVLAGQTWSTFYDPQAAPEEVDFEGISGKVLLRQPQVRWFPKIGEDWDLQVALEDPQAQVTEYCDPNNPADGGCGNDVRVIADGASDIPDGIVSIRRNWSKRNYVKVAAVVRDIRAISNYNDVNTTDSTTGWGLTVSSVIRTNWWTESDNFKLQLTGGRGIGRYINDTTSIDGLDAVFDESQNIRALPLIAGFAAYEHWWSQRMRSTLLFSFVNVDNYSFQPDTAYRGVRRISGNYFWSPIPRVDIGAELLFGKRINKDKNSANATQVQLMTRYRF